MRPIDKMLAQSILGTLCIILVIGLALPVVQDFLRPRRGRRSACHNNLRGQILAVHNYQNEQGSFPAVYRTDTAGNPILSWRVTLLPFIEEQARYDQIDLDQPWFHPGNQRLATPIPATYRCPDDQRSRHSPGTSYVAIAGPASAWPAERRISFVDVTDGGSATIAIVETSEVNVHWMSPQDLDLTELATTGKSGKPLVLNSPHEGGSNVALLDGSVRFLADKISPEVLQALGTIDGGEVVEEDW